MYHCMLIQPEHQYGSKKDAAGLLYGEFLSDRQNRMTHYNWTQYSAMYSIFREWFICLAQGGSFQKIVSGIMTKKEAVVFLKGPYQNEIIKNVWWAKLNWGAKFSLFII